MKRERFEMEEITLDFDNDIEEVVLEIDTIDIHEDIDEIKKEYLEHPSPLKRVNFQEDSS